MEDKSIYLLPNNQRFVELDSSQAFENLTKQEKLYAHYLSKVRTNIIKKFSYNVVLPLITIKYFYFRLRGMVD